MTRAKSFHFQRLISDPQIATWNARMHAKVLYWWSWTSVNCQFSCVHDQEDTQRDNWYKTRCCMPFLCSPVLPLVRLSLSSYLSLIYLFLFTVYILLFTLIYKLFYLQMPVLSIYSLSHFNIYLFFIFRLSTIIYLQLIFSILLSIPIHAYFSQS